MPGYSPLHQGHSQPHLRQSQHQPARYRQQHPRCQVYPCVSHSGSATWYSTHTRSTLQCPCSDWLLLLYHYIRLGSAKHIMALYVKKLKGEIGIHKELNKTHASLNSWRVEPEPDFCWKMHTSKKSTLLRYTVYSSFGIFNFEKNIV
jgi:hypothetical protein